MYEFLITAFVTMFIIIDPIGLLPLFIALTQGMNKAERRGVAMRALTVAFFILTIFGIAGDSLLAFVGIGMSGAAGTAAHTPDALAKLTLPVLDLFGALDSDRVLNSAKARADSQAGNPGFRQLRIAGADQIMNPYLITGRRMAAELVTPAIVEFLDVVMQRGELELRIEEIGVGPGSMLDGRTLGQCNVRGNTGVNVLAVQHPDKSINTNLDPDFILYADDSLICLGTPAQLAALSGIAAAD